MCGIVGQLVGQVEAGPEQSLCALEHAVEAVAQAAQSGHFEELGASLAYAIEQVEPLLSCGAVSVLQHEMIYVLLVRCGSLLEQIRSFIQEKTSGALPFEEREAWNRVDQMARDLAWRIEQDFLESQRGLQELFVLPWDELTHQAAQSLWAIDMTLRNLHRLEIRGRDSAGISVMVRFASQASIMEYLDAIHEVGLWQQWEERGAIEGLESQAISGATLLPETQTLSFLYKVASEVGSIGQNIGELREQIYADTLLRIALLSPGATAQPLAHTRWASNGIINVVNAHPQGCDVRGQTASNTRLFATLNGDIDNVSELLAGYRERTGQEVPVGVTTDAKIIPLLVEEAYLACDDLREAFRVTLSKLEGSFAIALHHLDEPGRVWLGIGGSGQALYVGIGERATFFASELYGIVEGTRRFVKLDGDIERIPGDPSTRGQLLELRTEWIERPLPFEAWSFDGAPLPKEDWTLQTAEITTRDIDIAGYPHFFLKEIRESVDSVRNTIRGRFFLTEGQPPRLELDESCVPASVIGGLCSERIRQIYCIGQGTAAIAAMGVASALRDSLPPSLHIAATKASELSGHMLVEDMTDTLVIAVSQSGTTTDTNRTVELLRQRGASILAILNRRNSDLAFKADGVIYTSDGRDVEMSVASTKAFYSQVTAGVLLSLYLGHKSGHLSTEQLAEPLRELEALPALMKQVLAMGEQIKQTVHRVALKRRYWAVVGSGSNQIAAHEIRIKLSELCYKSMSCDTIEDKKHIDLSAEPLMLVCAAGLDDANLSDAVKEVAIFKAHSSIPVVIASHGADDFREYAEEVFAIPDVSPRLTPILTTIVGHLFGYYTACAIDEQASYLRSLRGSLLDAMLAAAASDEPATDAIDEALVAEISGLQEWLLRPEVNATLEVNSGVQLALLSQRFSFAALALRGNLAGHSFGSVEENAEELLTHLSGAIRELSRPIDAIKHQAKTVTVGISRSAPTLSGPIYEALHELALAGSQISRNNMAYLTAVEPLLSDVSGATLYRVVKLDPDGYPGPHTQIFKEAAIGAAARMSSMTSVDATLKGSKWLTLKNDAVFIGIGRRDGRHIAIIPLKGEAPGEARILLLHLVYNEDAGLRDRRSLMRHRGYVYDQFRAATTELQLAWDDSILCRVPVETLFDDNPDRFIMALAGRWSEVERAQAIQREAQSMASWPAWPAMAPPLMGHSHRPN